MSEEKARHTVWLTNETWAMVKKTYHSDNCTTQNEYIEKAVRFYTGYLHAQEAGAYLPRILAEVLESKLIVFGERIDKLLFKLLVQDAIMANLIAADTDVDLQTLESLTGTCIKTISRIHGVLGFEDALKFQKELT